MALKLRVISDHYKALGKRSSQLFGVTGGRIGRSQDNDWILPDPDRYVSSHHAKVSFRAGEWVLEDTSTNGVFINGSDTPASVEGPYSLKDGDRLRLGDYDIIVSIDDRNDFSADASGQIPAPKRIRNVPSNVGEDLGEELDLTDLLTESAIRHAPPAMKAASEMFDLSRMLTTEAPAESKPAPAKAAPPTLAAPPVQSPAKPAKPRSGFASLLDGTDEGNQRTVAQPKKNDDWQMQTRPYDRKTMSALPNNALARTDKTEADKARRPLGDSLGADASGLEAFCRGAGIDPSSLPTDAQNALLTQAGQMLREVVLGLMESLKGRADLKNRLRLSQTTIQPAENNPLKFSPSVDEAVSRLLDPHSSRYLSPIEAIRDSFADLRNHHVSLSAGIQAAIDELMSRIEPGELQEKFDRGLKRGSLLGAANKMKYWDLYVEFYQTLNQRNDQGLPVLFAEELARTYAERAAQKKK
jgi:type VI secretion system protein